MTDMTVAELKAHFSEVLSKVQSGESYRILYGRSHHPVAQLAPLPPELDKRKIGALKGKIKTDATIEKFESAEEFLGLV